MGAADAGGGLDLLHGGAHPHPQLAVARIGVELLARAGGARPEVEHGLVRRLALGQLLTRHGQRLEDQDRVGLEIGPRAGHVGEGRMGAEAVVAVVVPSHQRSRGNDQALAGEARPQGGSAPGRPAGGVVERGEAGGAGAPARADELAEGPVGGLTGAVVDALAQGLVMSPGR